LLYNKTTIKKNKGGTKLMAIKKKKLYKEHYRVKRS